MRRIYMAALAAALLLAAPAGTVATAQDRGEAAVRGALLGHYAALQARNVEGAADWLTADYFYVAPWGALEFRDEALGRYREAFAAGRLQNYRAEVRDLHVGPAGEGARWFRAVVREKYRRESGRRARNAFAEDLVTSGVAVLQNGRWRIRFMQQNWSEETLRRMVPILHAAQPVDPEEY